MKKIILLNFVMALLIAGCSKSTSKTVVKTSPQLNISGTWYVVNDTVIDRNNGVTTEYDGTASGYVFDGTFFEQYNTDGSGITSSAAFVTKFTYTVKSNILTVNTPAQTVIDPNDGSTINFDASIETGTIRNLSSTSMVLYYDDKFTGGEDIETKYLSKIKP